MRRIGILGAALGSVVAMTTVGGAAQAHPPDNPYDNTIFAPVRTGGVGIGLDSVTRGLTAPVKAVAVPGHRHRLFVTDQVGRLSSLELTSGRATVRPGRDRPVGPARHRRPGYLRQTRVPSHRATPGRFATPPLREGSLGLD